MTNNSEIQLNSQNPQIYDNTDPKVININADSLDNQLRDLENSIKKKGSLLPEFGLLVTILAILVTVEEFKLFLGLEGVVWQSFFIFALVTITVIFLYHLINSIFIKGVTRKSLIDKLITKKKIEEASATLKIIDAKYGKGDKWLDVKNYLEKKITNGEIVAKLENDLFDHHDPYKGVIKSLYLVYFDGKEIRVDHIEEHTEFKISQK